MGTWKGEIFYTFRDFSLSSQTFVQWQPVQGGLNANETTAQAVLREVQEELGLMPHQYQVVEELPTPISYNFPVFDGLAHRHDDFVGQDLFWWVIYYEGRLEECFLDNAKVSCHRHSLYLHRLDLLLSPFLSPTNLKEFSSVKWTDWEGLLTECPWYKVDMYKKVKRWAQPVVDGFLSKQRKNKTVV